MAIYLVWHNQKPSNICRKSKEKFGCGINSKHRPHMLWRSPEFFLRVYEHHICILSLILVFLCTLLWLTRHKKKVRFKTYLYQRDLCFTFCVAVKHFTGEWFIHNTYSFKDKVQLGWMYEQYWLECIQKNNVLNEITYQII